MTATPAVESRLTGVGGGVTRSGSTVTAGVAACRSPDGVVMTTALDRRVCRAMSVDWTSTSGVPSAPRCTRVQRPSGPRCHVLVPGSNARSNSQPRCRVCAGEPSRDEHLDPAVEVAVHEVGRADPDLGLAAVVEPKSRECSRNRPRMLRTRMFSRQPGHARAQRADAAHPDVDGHAGLRRAVERVDGGLVDDRVALEADARRAGRPGGSRPRARCARRGRSAPSAVRRGSRLYSVFIE